MTDNKGASNSCSAPSSCINSLPAYQHRFQLNQQLEPGGRLPRIVGSAMQVDARQSGKQGAAWSPEAFLRRVVSPPASSCGSAISESWAGTACLEAAGMASPSAFRTTAPLRTAPNTAPESNTACYQLPGISLKHFFNPALDGEPKLVGITPTALCLVRRKPRRPIRNLSDGNRTHARVRLRCNGNGSAWT